MEENNERERLKDVKRHRARIYSGLTVISGVMLPNFCNTDSVCTAVQLILALMWSHTLARHGTVMYNFAVMGSIGANTTIELSLNVSEIQKKDRRSSYEPVSFS